MIPADWLDQAIERIAPHIQRTSLTRDAELNIFLKWENQQVTGSFKVRGALNKILALKPDECKAGIVTASAGNHGQGVALAGRLVGAPVTVFAAGHAVPTKVAAMRTLGAEVRFVDGGYELAESTAICFASEQKQTWVSAYNDGQVIAGQGTIGLEILQQLDPGAGTSLVVPVGGGGLIAGIGSALDRIKTRPRLVGVQAKASAFMHALYTRGSQAGVRDLPSLADGLSGAVEASSVTIPLVHHYVDELLLVTEEEIERAIVFSWQSYRERIEGSAAVGLAAVLNGKVKSPAVVVISGGNIQPEVHEQLCRKYPNLSC
jgi:threonine dehydratase